MIFRKQKRLRHDHGGAAGLHFPARCLLQTGKRTCGPPGLQIIIRSMHTKMDAETASMASTAVCASEQAEAAQKVCAERAVWSCIVVRAIVHASFLLRCSDFSAADGIFQVINFIKLSPGPAKKLGDSAGNRPGSRRGLPGREMVQLSGRLRRRTGGRRGCRRCARCRWTGGWYWGGCPGRRAPARSAGCGSWWPGG